MPRRMERPNRRPVVGATRTPIRAVGAGRVKRIPDKTGDDSPSRLHYLRSTAATMLTLPSRLSFLTRGPVLAPLGLDVAALCVTTWRRPPRGASLKPRARAVVGYLY